MNEESFFPIIKTIAVTMWEIKCPYCETKAYTKNKFIGIWICDNCEKSFVVENFNGLINEIQEYYIIKD